MARLASRYSAALFSLAAEKNKLDSYLEQTYALKKCLCDDEEIKGFINNPNLSSDDKLNILKGVLEGKAEDDIIGFISVIFEKNRQKELPLIFDEFTEMVLESKGIVTAHVESAYPLSDKQKDEIKTILSGNLNKQVIVESGIDKSLIGGLKITVDGHVIDGTIRKNIDDMKKMLLKNRLA